MKKFSYPFGSVRLGVGIFLFFGTLGRADQTPLTLNMLPMTLLGVLLAVWGMSRKENHVGLKRVLRRLAARVPRTRQQRRQHIYLRAAR
ncbi:hypothetical protein MF271_19050 (plasmid) [Deinococcus sp. KNUC1210]|uniref:hypothetical protein n=1 Tax=Deinococcus sp. KNUC1210 TaxID=2917691 RepID=UPI001EF0B127|nr:hypothetical protein [Deinococcus sp. KNUC1210]ULH17419.1 hypothetical protein MF271_19050 [Deinococcus sp. KNUC1210]